MRLTHYQLCGEPVITPTSVGLWEMFYVRCACGARVPEGEGFINSIGDAANAAHLHEKSTAFEIDTKVVDDRLVCSAVIGLARSTHLRELVARAFESMAKDEREEIALWCERATIREAWRAAAATDVDDAQRALAFLSAMAWR